MSFEQRKRVSIGVELAANPSLLFLDEPTTGLDSRAARIIIRCLQRVASTGRSLVATIHQPSREIFTSFHNLLLLRRGGETVYFGELGENAQQLIDFFSSVPGAPSLFAHQNPASWMLTIIGAGTTGRQNGIDFHAYYKKSALCAVNSGRVSQMCDSSPTPADETNAQNGDGCLPIFSPFFGRISSTFSHPFTREEYSVATHSDIATENEHMVSLTAQYTLLQRRAFTFYWRTPTYNYIRIVISLLVGVVFAATCRKGSYSSSLEIISAGAAIYMTLVFIGLSPSSTPLHLPFLA
jgi:hypothetical protein